MQKNQLFTILFIALSLTLLSFVNPKNLTEISVTNSDSIVKTTEVAEAEAKTENSLNTTLYNGLSLEKLGLSKEAFDYALKGYQKLIEQGKVNNEQYLTVIDFSQSGRKKRFYLIDVQNQKLVHNTFVSHGKNSGVDMATKFSNTINSEQSSLGFYVTTATYTGKHGLSLRLSGKEAGFNDNAEARGIVMHGAAYVNSGRVNSAFMGRSQGCPALSEAEYAKVINIIKGGTVLFIYHPSKNYIQGSPLLNS